MSRLLIYIRRHWPAMLVLGYFIWQLLLGDFHSDIAMWVALGFALTGLAMNLVVILVNRGMPAQVTAEQIPDDQQTNYHPINSSTRLAWLSDWIPVGNLLISPGDIVVLIAVGILLVGSFTSV